MTESNWNANDFARPQNVSSVIGKEITVPFLNLLHVALTVNNLFWHLRRAEENTCSLTNQTFCGLRTVTSAAL